MEVERDAFSRCLLEIADQLGSAQLQQFPQILQTRRLEQCIGSGLANITSYEQLFQSMYSHSLISPDDLTMLREILEELGKADLLYPLYEARMGGRSKGLQISRGSGSGRRSKTPTSFPSDCMLSSKTASTGISDFNLLLLNIGTRMSQENVKTLCYLLQDLLTRFKAATMQDGVDILGAVRQRNYIHDTQPDFLTTLLKDIGRDDLCYLVDEFKMTLTQHLQDDKYASICSKLKKKSDDDNKTWTRREYRFRLAMKKLADQLSPRDLETMKLLSVDVLSAGELEKIENILDLFWSLEDHGKLSIDNLFFLEELLEDKRYLLDAIYSQLSSSSQPNSRENSLTWRLKRGKLTSQEGTDKSFQKMLKCIGLGLTKQEVKHLKQLPAQHTSEDDKVKTGVQLMSHWRKLELVTPANVELLRKGLNAIGRQDLCREIALYHCAAQFQQQTTCTLPKQETISSTPTRENSVSTPSIPLTDIESDRKTVDDEGETKYSGSPSPYLQLPNQCMEDLHLRLAELEDEKHRLELRLQAKENEILRERIARLEAEAQVNQSDRNYKLVEQHNNCLLLENYELTLQIGRLQRQLEISTLTRSASKHGIFMTTPV